MTKNKYLFIFNDKETRINCEVFAEDMMKAQEKVCRILGVHKIGQPVFFTENWDCSRCRHTEEEE